MKIGIIGGTGFYEPSILDSEKDLNVETPYGNVSLKSGSFHGRNVFFLSRHGVKHTVPPHLVNYRANIWALRNLGVKKVIATAAVGSLNKVLKPGEIVVIDQFLDFTKNRPQTFFDDGEVGVLHVDMTYPYCPSLREKIIQVGCELNVEIHQRGTYVCTEGPRYETPAEIQMYRILGGDVVGMTSVPEVVLAREAELCYATLAIVTNYAAGISSRPLSHREVVETMNKAQDVLRNLIFYLIDVIDENSECQCRHAANELGSLGIKSEKGSI